MSRSQKVPYRNSLIIYENSDLNNDDDDEKDNKINN